MMNYLHKILLIEAIIIFVSCLLPSTVTAQPPAEGLVLWISADSLEENNDDEIINLVNEVDLSISSVPTIKAVKSELEELDDHAALNFTGVEAFYDFGLSVPLPLTTFVLYYTGNNAQQFFYDTDNRMLGYLTSLTNGQYGANLSYNFTSSPYFKISTFSTANTGSKIFVNGVLRNQGNSDRPISNSFRLGSSWANNRYFDGYIAEVLVYSSALTDQERVEVENYLMNRYSPPVSLIDSAVLIPSCNLELSVKSRFKAYQWTKILEDESIQILGDQPTQEISQEGEYVIQVTDIFDRVSSDTITVVGINTDDLVNSTACSEFGVGINLGFEESLFEVEWSDPALTGPQVEITEPGDYSVEITQSDGCSYQSPTFTISDIEEITEIDQPELFCSGNSLEADAGNYNGVNLLWSTDETTNSIIPTSSGEYWVEATNANGCVGRDTVVIDIAGAAPFVEFTSGTACVGNAVVFTDETFPEGSTITGQDWVFEFPQTPADSLQGAVVETEFAEAGEYPVELTVTLATGCTGTGRDTVTVNPLPLVSFNFDEVVPCAGNEVAFESESGVPGDGEIASYAWTFGNGTSDVGIVGTTTFANLGVNTVQLEVTTTDGCVDSLLSNVVVLGSPAVDFNFDTVCVGMPTVFNEAVDVTESGPVFYNWQFGDGFFSNFPNTSHVYGAPGVYNVQLTATGNDFGGAGCVDQLTRQVRVYAAPEGNIETTDACLGEGVVFTDLTEAAVQGGVGDSIDTRAWVLPFGYGQGPVAVGGDSVQVWNALESGSYAVEMSFVTEAGCTGMATANVDVLAVPEASFSLEVPEVAPPFGVGTTNTSVDAQGYVWMIDGDVVSTAAEPELLIPDTGEYVVSLVATNALGCNDTTSFEVEAINPQYDLALVDIRYVISGGRLTLRAVLGNNGNVPIREFELAVSLGLSAEVEAVMEFDLGAGEVREFTLPETFGYLSARDLPYVCMEVGLERFGIAEFDLENNGFCIGLEKEKAVFIDPYPNPVSSVLRLGFVLPVSGEVFIGISDSGGKLLKEYSSDEEEGYGFIDFDMSGFSEGVYFVRYEFGGEEVVKRVLVVE